MMHNTIKSGLLYDPDIDAVYNPVSALALAYHPFGNEDLSVPAAEQYVCFIFEPWWANRRILECNND